MKSSEFKKLIKESVKEAIQEELKDILYEAFKSQKNTSQINENIHNFPSPNIQTNNISPSPSAQALSPEERRAKYEEALNGTQLNFTSNDVQTFRPQPGADSINGSLGEGSVSMDQITSLLNK